MLYHLLFFYIFFYDNENLKKKKNIVLFSLNLKNVRDRNVFPLKDFLNVNS